MSQVLIEKYSETTTLITLNRPEKRNALSQEMMEGMSSYFKEENLPPLTILKASSDSKIFCSGADLSALGKSAGVFGANVWQRSYMELLLNMASKETTVAVMSEGDVLAGGVGLFFAADLAYLSASSRLRTPELRVGLFPYMVSAFLEDHLNPKELYETLMLYPYLDAKRLKETGLINGILAEGDMEKKIKELDEHFSSLSPAVLKLGKRTLSEARGARLKERMSVLADRLGMNTAMEDAMIGITAFFSKKKPEWKGR